MGNMLVFSTIVLSIAASTYYSDKSFIINLWDQLNKEHEKELDHEQINDLNELNSTLQSQE